MPDIPDTHASPAGDRAAEARRVLIDSLAHLVDEIDLLRGVIGRVPEPVVDGRPTPSDRTLKEFYLLVAAADAHVFTPAAERLAAADASSVPAPEDDALLAAEGEAADASIEQVLDRVVARREALVAAFRAFSEEAWRRTVRVGDEPFDGYGLAHRAVEATGERLREAGYRLHESRLTDRPQGLPK